MLEMLVVLAILAVALTLAFNGRSALDDRHLAGMARKIETDVRVLEQRARTERTCYRVDFDVAADAYAAYRYRGAVTPGGGGSSASCDDASGWETTPAIGEVAGDTVSRRMPRGIDLVSATFPPVGSVNVLRLGPFGNATAGTVTLRSGGGATRQIVVEVFGRVTVRP
jgi:hypothetical protein